VVTAPFNGKVKTVFPTKHALGLESDEGLELLIHIGIDTVKLNGHGFETLVEANQIIEQGQPLVKLDLEYIEQHAPSIITPLIFTNLKQQDVELVTTDKVNEGDLIINIKIKD
jgi:glucose-specific phosphotransferase system IIA component